MCTKDTNVTNPKPLQGSFQTFRKYVGFEATFRSDNPKIFDTGHVYVLDSESCSERLSPKQMLAFQTCVLGHLFCFQHSLSTTHLSTTMGL